MKANHKAKVKLNEFTLYIPKISGTPKTSKVRLNETLFLWGGIHSLQG